MNVMSEPEVEAEIQAKGLNAPHLTPEDICESIKSIEYWVVPNTTTTVCAMIFQNNYVITGTSAAASMDNFDQEVGRNIAYENARQRIWPLLGYVLNQKFYKQGN